MINNDCITCQFKKPYTQPKQIAEKNKILKDNVYTLTTESHLIKKDQYHPLQKETHIYWSFTHYLALNPVPHCNAYYAYTTLYEHWIAKL